MNEQLFDTTELEAILKEYGENVKKGYQQKLKDHGRPTQENTLASTITVEVEKNGTRYAVYLNLQEYWKYVESGTRPHWAPIAPLLHWVEVKPLLPRPEIEHLPRPQQLKRMAYAVRWKIAQEGTKGTHDLKETTDTLEGYYEERIAEALGRATFDYLEKLIDDTAQLIR